MHYKLSHALGLLELYSFNLHHPMQGHFLPTRALGTDLPAGPLADIT